MFCVVYCSLCVVRSLSVFSNVRCVLLVGCCGLRVVRCRVLSIGCQCVLIVRCVLAVVWYLSSSF